MSGIELTTAQMEYRCRRCGGIHTYIFKQRLKFRYRNPHDKLARQTTMDVVLDGYGTSTIHYCADGGYGYADFIGTVGIKPKKKGK